MPTQVLLLLIARVLGFGVGAPRGGAAEGGRGKMRDDSDNVREWIGRWLKRGDENRDQAPPSSSETPPPPPRRILNGSQSGGKRRDRVSKREGCFCNYAVLAKRYLTTAN